jgi:hypothetical protein
MAKNCGDRRAFSAERISYLQEPVNELFCQDKWMVSMTRDGISLEIERSIRAPGPLTGPGQHVALDRSGPTAGSLIQTKALMREFEKIATQIERSSVSMLDIFTRELSEH